MLWFEVELRDFGLEVFHDCVGGSSRFLLRDRCEGFSGRFCNRLLHIFLGKRHHAGIVQLPQPKSLHGMSTGWFCPFSSL